MLPLILAIIEDADDRELITEYYNRHRFTLLHVAQSILHDHGLAEDAVQEAFLRLAKNIKNVRPDRREVRSFLTTITRNTACDILKQRKPMLSWDALVYEPADDRVNVEEQIVQDDMIERLAQTLPIIYSTVFLLRYKHDCGDRTIAALLDISEATVRKRLQRAKEKITEEVMKKGVGCGA